MLEMFGPNTANQVDNMSEDDCVAKCRAKTLAFLGEDKAKQFDKI